MPEGRPGGAASSLALDELRRSLRDLGSVVVAFSGGADSAFLAWVAHDTLGVDRAHAVTAVSPSLADDERAHCAELAERWGLRWREVHTTEHERPEYRANGGDRCWYCKDALMDALQPVAQRSGATVLLGVNTDDLADHRPGQQAAAVRGARFPLVEAGFAKADVRAWSRRLGLPTWDKPAAPCLASRVPYGTAVTVGVLGRVERAEAAVRRLGYRELRVRHHGDRASVELAPSRLPLDPARRRDVVAAVMSAGYHAVDIDPQGLRSGHLNDALR